MKKGQTIKVTFPVDFEILSSDKKRLLSGFQEAFTTQVDRELLRVKFTPAEEEILSKLSDPSSVLSLIIHIPSYYKPLTAYGKARDIEVSGERKPPRVRMTIDLVEMQNKERKLLTEYARWVKWRPRFLLLLLAVIVALGGSAISYSYFLIKEDFRLRAEIRDAGAESVMTMRRLTSLLEKKTELEAQLMAIEQRLAEQIENSSAPREPVIDMKVPALEKEKREFERKLRAAEDEKKKLRKQVNSLRDEKKKLEAQIAVKTAIPSETVRVTFKNGRTITGKLIGSDENHIKLKIGYRPVTLSRKTVKNVDFVTSKQKAAEDE